MSGVCFHYEGEQQTNSKSDNKTHKKRNGRKVPNINRKFMIIIVMRNAVLGGGNVSVNVNVRGFIPKRTLANKKNIMFVKNRINVTKAEKLSDKKYDGTFYKYKV